MDIALGIDQADTGIEFSHGNNCGSAADRAEGIALFIDNFPILELLSFNSSGRIIEIDMELFFHDAVFQKDRTGESGQGAFGLRILPCRSGGKDDFGCIKGRSELILEPFFHD